MSINQGLSWAGSGGPGRGWASPAHQFFKGWAAARPSPSHFIFNNLRPGPLDLQICRPGPAMTLAARPMRHGLYTGWPAISVGRPMYCPVLKGERICADAFFSLYLYCTSTVNKIPPRFFPSGIRGLAHEPHVPTTRIILPHQRPAPMASVPISGPTFFCCCDAHSSSSSSSSSSI